LLRALVEQKTALLGAHAESMRLQRVLLERLLASDQTLTVAIEAAPATPAPGPHDGSERKEMTALTVEAVGRDEPAPAVDASTPMVATVDGLFAVSYQPIVPVSGPPPGERTALRVVGGTAIRGERYYKSAQSTPAPRISLEGLDTLKRIQSAGEVAQLILVFGPHTGETLGQVAQSDPDYVRRLALTAQRSDVRAAAAQVASALGEPAAPARRSRAGWRRTGGAAR
jgi:hypothetical protein